MAHYMIDVVDENVIDSIIERHNPEKIVIFTSDDDDLRQKYENIYPKYNSMITMYEGDVDLHVKTYMERNSGKEFFTLFNFQQ